MRGREGKTAMDMKELYVVPEMDVLDLEEGSAVLTSPQPCPIDWNNSRLVDHDLDGNPCDSFCPMFGLPVAC